MTMQERTFNRVTKSIYRKPVAAVYGTVRGVPFRNVYKNKSAAERAAERYNGVVVIL